MQQFTQMPGAGPGKFPENPQPAIRFRQGKRVVTLIVPTLDQVRGVTFNVPESAMTDLFLNGQWIPRRELSQSSGSGEEPSIGVRWFKPDTTDHVAGFRRDT